MGFALPPLDVTFHNDRDECHGFNGTSQLEGEVAVINICVVKRHTILRELGHAWEAQAITDETRMEFMRYRGLTSWNDQDVNWDERAVEQAAVTIAMVLKWQSGSTDNPEFVERLCSYEILTGTPLPDSVPVGCEVGRPVGPTLRQATAADVRSTSKAWSEPRAWCTIGWGAENGASTVRLLGGR